MDYVELHCHSHYSFLDGASSPEALVARAAALGYPALALTDHNNLSGAVHFWRAAQDQGIRPIIGAEITLSGKTSIPSPIKPASGPTQEQHLTLLAETQQGYANLCRLISTGQLSGQKGNPRLTIELVASHARGLLCLSGCRQGAVPAALLAGDAGGAWQAAGRLREIFGPDNFWIEVQQHSLPTDARLAAALFSLARKINAEVVLTNNVHYAERTGQRLHDILSCIRQGVTLPEALAAGLLRPNSENHMKSPREMLSLFRDVPGHSAMAQALPRALRNTVHIAGRCDVSLDFSTTTSPGALPVFPAPDGHSPQSYLCHLCEIGLRRRFSNAPVGQQPPTRPTLDQARGQLAHELAVIERLNLASYFLVVWDIVHFARQQGIRCQGRGSAANSLVAYLLGITPVDPLRHNLLFERFLSETNSGTLRTMPDIDVDFAADRREEVIQYVYNRYGEEHVGMVCNVVTYRARSALRETAKALAFPVDVVDRLAKTLDTRSCLAAAQDLVSMGAHQPDLFAPGPSVSSLPWLTLAEVLGQMDGIPRHLSIHVGGMLITAAPLVEVVPLERATMPGRVVVQWNKDSVEDAGLIKIDILSLRTLGAITETLEHIQAQRGFAPDLDRLPLDNAPGSPSEAIFDLLRRADTVGCFQVESRAQAQMLPKLQPTRFEDIVIGVALIRPGPIQGGMVHPYLRRRQGLEPVTYLHPALEPVLAETMGVIVFQEQVIRVAMAVARFTPAEADQLRRAMSRSRSQEAMMGLRQRFLEGAQANGIGQAEAEDIFQQLAGFAGFGFCKSHAAAFALVAYQTLYLKTYFPAEYTCALLNHQPMGFYPPEVLIGDARRHGVSVLHPDINRSLATCTLENSRGAAMDPASPGLPAIRLGLRYVHGLGEVWQACIVQQRDNPLQASQDAKPFSSLRDFCQRTHLPKTVVENLIRAGAMDSLGHTRRDLLWELGALVYQEESQPTYQPDGAHDMHIDLDVPVEWVALPALSQAERMAWEHELLGLAPGDHVMDLYRPSLQSQGVLSCRDLAACQDGERVRLAGYAVVRQRPPTAKGYLFITLEDEEGLMNLIVRPHIYERYRHALRNAPLLWVEGRLQREGLALSVLVHSAGALGPPSVPPPT